MNPLSSSQPVSPEAPILLALEAREAALKARIEELEGALRECAKPWASPPGLISDCFNAMGDEFQRRLDLAASALQPKASQ